MLSFIFNFFKKSQNKELDSYLEIILGFKPNTCSFYYQALTHSTTVNNKQKSNERLEFLGDSVLNTIISDFLYKKFPKYSEGKLSNIKSLIVNRRNLDVLGKKINLNTVMKLNLSNPPDSIYGNALEALIGAIYLDQGFEKTNEFVLKLIKKHSRLKELEQHYRNYKGELIEWAQKNKKTIDFKLINEETVGHEKLFKVQLLIDEELISEAQNNSKKIAEKIASQLAFNTIFVSKSNR